MHRPPEDDPQFSAGPRNEPLWFARINPLRRSRLSDRRLRGILANLARAERLVRSAATQSSDELFQRIGATRDEAVRKQLVALRRAIHNDRAPNASAPAPTPGVALWLAAREQRQALRDETESAYQQALSRERCQLAALLGDADLRCALTLTAPEIFKESERYRSAVADPGSAPARLRKPERGLIQYVTRAMVRTSPMSRFTAVGIAEPDENGVALGDMRFEKATAFPELDRAMLSYVLGGLPAPDGDALPDAWAGLPPTSALDPDGGKLYFLQPTDTGMQRRAALVTPPIRLLLDAVVMGPRPVGSLVSHIVTKSGCRPQDAVDIVARAVQAGILCSFSAAEDGAAELQAMLTPASSADPAAARLFGTVAAGLSRLEAAPAAERGDVLASVRSGLAQLSHLARRPAQVTVQEDYVMPPLKVATGQWRRSLGDLGAAVELLSVFDWLQDVRVIMTAAFVQRFGAGAAVSLAEHADFLVSEVSRRAAVMGEVYGAGGAGDAAALAGLGPADGCLEQLYLLRLRMKDLMHARICAAVDAQDDQLTLSASDVAELTAGLPERFRHEPLIYGVLLQQSGEHLIVNDGLPGHGMLYARFLDADRRLGGSALPRLAERLTRHYGADGSRVVEDLGLHRLNVNAHARVLPGGLQPDDWFSLRLAHDPDTDTLQVEDAQGARLRVLPLGTGHPGLFPAPLSVASGLVISGRLYNGLPDSWHSAVPWNGQQTRVCPRMFVGDVMIARRRWYGGDELAAAVAAGPGEHDRLLAITAWRSRHDVAEEVVIKTAPEDESPLSVGAPDVQGRRLQHKPQYVDLASALSVRVLPRMMERRTTDTGGTDYLEEALPGVVDGTHAAEWVVEVGRRSGGRFHYGEDLG